MAIVTNGKEVSIEYRICLTDGTEVESNVGDLELTYIQGSHEIFPALEDALEGLGEGEHAHITLKAKDAYGAIDDQSFQLIELDLIPEELRYRGAELSVEDESGDCYNARLAMITELGALVDFNHPLAGHTLVFDICVLSIDDGKPLN